PPAVRVLIPAGSAVLGGDLGIGGNHRDGAHYFTAPFAVSGKVDPGDGDGVQPVAGAGLRPGDAYALAPITAGVWPGVDVGGHGGHLGHLIGAVFFLELLQGEVVLLVLLSQLDRVEVNSQVDDGGGDRDLVTVLAAAAVFPLDPHQPTIEVSVFGPIDLAL